ncbi:MAG: DNA-directed RNA polymerase subunit beta' [Bacilli bacterium]|nr:DNA-directed RNA polymerase subunit beta' [Bacilli bacterium]
MMDVNNFEGLKIGIASPEKIRSWSYGEVKKAETINYRTLKPERDGLFCEKIFGPTKDFECSCGKYKRLRYKNIICDRCGVEVTRTKVRRERMGHIELAAPVSHIWFFKGIPSRMGLVLDMSPRDLEEVLYFVSYVVLDPGAAPLEKKQIISDKEYRTYYEKYGESFRVGMGAAAIKELLSQVELEKEIDEIKEEIEEIKDSTSQKRIRLIKRLDVLNAFVESGNRPEWMILDALPVIPPELRPMIQLDGGRFATSDLNDLYRRVINRNNRLKKLLELDAPSIIIQNEKRMLQEAVDALFDNGRRGRNITGAGNRPLKSLSSMLKGKQGRFRQNLLGKRVDYSGRSVIVVGPNLKMYECGIPKEMALELFKPHVIHGLVSKEIASNIKAAKRMIENQDPRVWDIVEEKIKEHPILLNRAPTLHRLGIQAFQPKLTAGRSIRLHPLVCAAFNADFDGDQMAVHVPLSEEAQTEARVLMLGANNILSPKDGKPIVTPSQDMVLGNYYLTIEKANEPGEGRIFKDSNEAMMAYERQEITLHARIAIPVRSFKYKIFPDNQMDKYLVTTVGKVIFNEIFADSFQYINEGSTENIERLTPNKFFIDQGENIPAKIKEMPLIDPLNKSSFSQIIAQNYKRYHTTETSVMLDKLKDLGFKYSTKSGISISISDLHESKIKKDLLVESQEKVDLINKQHRRGLITEQERHEQVTKIWFEATDKISNELKAIVNEDKYNSISMMMLSKARGDIKSYTQLVGMRGLFGKPSGGYVEIPVTSSFSEGVTISEFFLSTHGARKGAVDTALKTADAGYLTRRLVDVCQDIVIKEEDCKTEQGVVVEAFLNENDGTNIESLFDRIVGRFTNKKVLHPETKEVLAERNEYITEQLADKIIKAGITKVPIRTVLTCKTKKGLCQKCYGRNLATGSVVEIGEAVGIMAAQSIGEPGTQLTMRTFNTGGVAGDDITQGLPRVQELFEARNPEKKATISEINGKVTKIAENGGNFIIAVTNDVETKEHTTFYHMKPIVELGQDVKAGQRLTQGAINPKELLVVTDPITVQQYILLEVQKVYRMQGVDISDKHIEVMARRMISKIKIINSGDSLYLPGTLININEFTRVNKELILEGKSPATGKPVLLGITKASLETDSFLSAAAFQETTRILTDAAIHGKVDHLEGLKENVIVGKLIPAGTGARKYKEFDYELDLPYNTEEPLEALEQELLD